MNQTSLLKDTSLWLGLTTGALGGALVSTITLWKVKDKHKKDTLYQNGKAQHESIRLIKQELETEARKKASS